VSTGASNEVSAVADSTLDAASFLEFEDADDRIMEDADDRIMEDVGYRVMEDAEAHVGEACADGVHKAAKDEDAIKNGVLAQDDRPRGRQFVPRIRHRALSLVSASAERKIANS